MDRLLLRQMLLKGKSLQSANGAYTLILQEDGSLVLYSRGIALWSRRTNGRAVNYAIMQTDGNFVLRISKSCMGYRHEWLGQCIPCCTGRDNVVIYGTKAAWATGTNRLHSHYQSS